MRGAEKECVTETRLEVEMRVRHKGKEELGKSSETSKLHKGGNCACKSGFTIYLP